MPAGCEPAVTITSPLDGKVADDVALLMGQHQDFNVEHETVDDGEGEEFARHVAPVDFETALGIPEVTQFGEHSSCQAIEKPGAEFSVQPLVLFDEGL